MAKCRSMPSGNECKEKVILSIYVFYIGRKDV